MSRGPQRVPFAPNPSTGRGTHPFALSRRQDGNVTNSARALRIAKTTLTDRIRKHGLS